MASAAFQDLATTLQTLAQTSHESGTHLLLVDKVFAKVIQQNDYLVVKHDDLVVAHEEMGRVLREARGELGRITGSLKAKNVVLMDGANEAKRKHRAVSLLCL